MARDQTGPLVRFDEIEIDPAHMDEYRALLSEEIEQSVRLEPGVLMLQALVVGGDTGNVRVVEVYADRAAYEAHLLSPHFLEYKSRTAGMVRGLRLFAAERIALAAKAGLIG